MMQGVCGVVGVQQRGLIASLEGVFKLVLGEGVGFGGLDDFLDFKGQR